MSLKNTNFQRVKDNIYDFKLKYYHNAPTIMANENSFMFMNNINTKYHEFVFMNISKNNKLNIMHCIQQILISIINHIKI